MNRRYTNDDLDDPREDEREISLGATTILGIFFALTLICAVCFGFGYAMRGHQTPPSPVAATPTETPTGSGEAKPSPVSLEPSNPAPAPATEDAPAIVPTDNTAAPQPDSAETTPSATAPKPVTPARAATPVPQAASAAKPGFAVVQVAAVSHKQDADFLLAALKKRGYNASIRQEPQDKLLHVQLGPYASKKDAAAVRDRLITDGYNPIVK